MFSKVIGRITARYFTVTLKIFFHIYCCMGKHPCSSTLCAVMLIGVAVMLYFSDMLSMANGNFLGMSSGSAIATPTEQKTSPEGQSNDFLNALADARAGDMYTLLSDDYKNLLKQRTIGNANAMQTRIND